MSQPAPHGPREVSPGAFTGFVVAAMGTPLLPFFPPFGWVLGAVGIVGALIFGACVAMVASSV